MSRSFHFLSQLFVMIVSSHLWEFISSLAFGVVWVHVHHLWLPFVSLHKEIGQVAIMQVRDTKESTSLCALWGTDLGSMSVCRYISPLVSMTAHSQGLACKTWWSVLVGGLNAAPGPPQMKKKTTKTWSAWGGKVSTSLKGEGPRASLSSGFY